MIILSTVEAAMSAATARDTRATTAVEAAVSAAINSIPQAARLPLQEKDSAGDTPAATVA